MPATYPEAEQARAQLRTGLVNVGFADDGDILTGSVRWTDRSGQERRSRVLVRPSAGFPHTPPLVRVHPHDDAGPSLHREHDGHLCLFDRSAPAGSRAPWLTAEDLLARVVRWFEQTDLGWPSDADVDLERYLPTRTSELVVFDSEELGASEGFLAVRRPRVPGLALTRVNMQLPGASGRRQRAQGRRRSRPQLPRAPYGRLLDVGELGAPLVTWTDITAHRPDLAGRLGNEVRFHGLELLLVRYSRNGNEGFLPLRVRASAGAPGGVELAAHDPADASLATRTLRAGDSRASLANRPVTIVGCGAVGGYVADLLLRAGLRRLRLIDADIVRPGNCVRHVAGDEHIGWSKVEATRAVLARTGLDVSRVKLEFASVNDFEQANAAFAGVHLVIDATADNRATQLLGAAAVEADRPLLSVALLRQGDIVVVDRLPSPAGDLLPSPATLPGTPEDVRERGCGDAVSRTPPHSVAAAAALAVRLAVGELTGNRAPGTVFEVLEPQPDAPFTSRGVISSPEPNQEGTPPAPNAAAVAATGATVADAVGKPLTPTGSS